MKYSINALHKTATVFLSKFFIDISRSKRFKYYSRDVSENNAKLFYRQRNCFLCPARGFPKALDKDVHYIFILRNPLDILVSEYFSFGWTHPIKGTDEEKENLTKLREDIQKMSLDDYCLKYADKLYNKFKSLLRLNLSKEGDNYHVITYEELVTNFKAWAYKIFEIVEVPEDRREFIYLKYKPEFEYIKEITPDQIFSGESKKHKRRILPGDHKDKLKNLTIIKLNHQFKKVLEFHESILNVEEDLSP